MGKPIWIVQSSDGRANTFFREEEAIYWANKHSFNYFETTEDMIPVQDGDLYTDGISEIWVRPNEEDIEAKNMSNTNPILTAIQNGINCV